MSGQKIHFTLSGEALAVIDRRAPSPNKRGEWISTALVDYDRILSGTDTGSGDSGVLERIESRLARIEKQLAAMLTSKA